MNDELQSLIKDVALAHDKLVLAEEAKSTAEFLERKAKRTLNAAQIALDNYTYSLVRKERKHITEIESLLEGMENEHRT